jgi:hypothetical protein
MTTAPMHDTNQRGDIGRQFRNRDRLKDEHFDAVLTPKESAEEIYEVFPISSAAIPHRPQKSEMKRSQFNNASDDLAMRE